MGYNARGGTLIGGGWWAGLEGDYEKGEQTRHVGVMSIIVLGPRAQTGLWKLGRKQTRHEEARTIQMTICRR